MPKSQTLPKPSVVENVEKPEESEPSIDSLEDLKPIPNHPLAHLAGMFRDSAFFDDVVENMRIREEEESKKYAEEE